MTLEELKKQEDKQAIDDLLFLLSRAEGRRFLTRLLEQCKTFQTGINEPIPMAFHQGMQHIGMSVFNLIMTHSPAKFLQMQNEHKSKLLQRKKINDEELNGKSN